MQLSMKYVFTTNRMHNKTTPDKEPFQTVDKVSEEALFFVAINIVIWYNKDKQTKQR